jgi:hypothetical protein
VYTPLRYQATESDCYPTCVLNALTWLFERREIPGAVVQHIYTFSLDGFERGAAASYTSECAGLALINWLSRFRSGSFAVLTDTVHGRDCHPGSSGKVERWLRQGGVAILDVIETPATRHSILALRAGSHHVDFWDPYIRGDKFSYGPGVVRLDSDGRSANLRIPRSRLDRARLQPYTLGPLPARTGALLRRARPGRRRNLPQP